MSQDKKNRKLNFIYIKKKMNKNLRPTLLEKKQFPLLLSQEAPPLN